MKHLILINLICVSLYANFMSEQGLDNCKNGLPYKVYIKNINGLGYDVTGKDCETHTLQDVQVDDTDKPIYASKVDFQDCILAEIEIDKELPANDCRVITANVNLGTEEVPQYAYPLCADSTFYAVYAYKRDFPETFPTITDDSLFAYCTKLLGYEQKTVKQLLPDQSLIDAKNAKLLDTLDRDKVREVLDLIQDRDALTQIIEHALTPQKYKDKATELRQAINQKLQEFFGL